MGWCKIAECQMNILDLYVVVIQETIMSFLFLHPNFRL
jgi:hypothetical protein